MCIKTLYLEKINIYATLPFTFRNALPLGKAKPK
jgi:hypothetical protein